MLGSVLGLTALAFMGGMSSISCFAAGAPAETVATLNAVQRLMGEARAEDNQPEDVSPPGGRQVAASQLGPHTTSWSLVPLVRSGQNGLFSIHRFPSVNDNGIVAFAATYNGGASDNIYAYHLYTGRLQKLLKDAWAHRNSGGTPRQTIAPMVQVNNLNQVVSRRFLTALVQVGFPLGDMVEMPLTYLEGWDPEMALPHEVNGVEIQPIQFAAGDAGIGEAWPLLFPLRPIDAFLRPTPFVPLSPLAGVQSTFSVNNAGESAFVGLLQDFRNFLCTTVFPPYLYNYHLPTGDTPRASINPVMADDGSVLVFERDEAVGRVRRYVNSLASHKEVAGPPEFLDAGTRPGMSDNGQFVAFQGFLSVEGADSLDLTPGHGVFAQRPDGRIVRLAGASGNGHLEPGEWYEDTNQNGEFDPDGGETDIGAVGSFLPERRVCINNQGYCLFQANNSSGNSALFLSRVNPADSTFASSDPLQLVAAGDPVPGLNGTIAELAIHDSLSNEGRPGTIVFWCQMDTGEQALVQHLVIRNPLVFVPGIGGSVLQRRTGNGLGPELWFSYEEEDLIQLSLHGADNPDPAIQATEITRTIRITVLDRVVEEVEVYQPLIRMLIEKDGRTEYQLDRDPARRTLAGFDTSQDANQPDLYVFPYDWRYSNEDSATRLGEYVAAIQESYRRRYNQPNLLVKPDLLAHSMGGLVASRYFRLRGGRDDTGRLVTIATPFLGAAKTPYILETGNWFFPINIWQKDTIRHISQSFIGAHELLTSAAYFTLGGRPFRERGWDLDGDGLQSEDYSTFAELRYTLDRRIATAPGLNAELFHIAPQDDWRSDVDGQRFLHIAGQQEDDDTITALDGIEYTDADGFTRRRFRRRYGLGDGTVPTLSAERKGNGLDFNATGTGAQVLLYQEGDAHTADGVEHNGLCANPRTFLDLLHFLRGSGAPTTLTLAAGPSAAALRPLREPAEPRVEVELMGARDVLVRNDAGEASRVIGVFVLDPKGVKRDSDGDFTQMKLRRGVGHVLDFTAVGGRVRIAVWHRLPDGTPAKTVWVDTPQRAGTRSTLTIPDAGGVQLGVDADGDGAFETVPATIAVEGAAAADESAPVVSFREVVENGQRLLSIEAQDEGSGVASIHYALDDGAFGIYDGRPLELSRLSAKIVRAFADDKSANRSVTARFDVPSQSTRGDLDGDGDVDRTDLAICMAARGKPAAKPVDPRDLDNDGRITVLDARILTTLFTRPGGATQ